MCGSKQGSRFSFLLWIISLIPTDLSCHLCHVEFQIYKNLLRSDIFCFLVSLSIAIPIKHIFIIYYSNICTERQIYSGFENFVRYVYCKYFLSFCGLPFFFLTMCFKEQKFLNLLKSSLYIFFSYGACFLNPKKYLSTPRSPGFFLCCFGFFFFWKLYGFSSCIQICDPFQIRCYI